MGLAGAGALVGCHRTGLDKASEAAPNGDAIKQSLGGLKSQLGDLETRFSALRKQVEAVPPELPGFREVRAKFYATEEGRGITDAKVKLLSDRLDAALTSGKPEELRQISKEITETNAEIGQINQLQITLLHQVMAFQRVALRQKETSAAPGAAPKIAKIAKIAGRPRSTP